MRAVKRTVCLSIIVVLLAFACFAVVASKGISALLEETPAKTDDTPEKIERIASSEASSLIQRWSSNSNSDIRTYP